MNYLTESSLIEFLRTIDKNGIHNKAFKPYKFRPDYVSEKYKFIVEFDGYLHYTKSKVCLTDIRKDEIYINEGYKIIRIPYFIQLDAAVMKYLFSDYITNIYDFSVYPHGFIDNKAVLPADYCTLGIKRYYEDLEKFYFLKEQINQSLINWIDKGKNYYEVFPIKTAEINPTLNCL